VIGIFDSGVGGLSILKAVQKRLPCEAVSYLADSGHAPYGERSVEFITERSLALAQHLIEQHQCAIIIVACNTATACAIEQLRSNYPGVAFVGVEPAVKPAAAVTQTGAVAVWATRGTLRSARFNTLVSRVASRITTLRIECDGLAAAIEHDDPAVIRQLCHAYAQQTVDLGQQHQLAVDTVVLGCTHYPFALPAIGEALEQAALSRPASTHSHPPMALMNPATAVAEQAARLLSERRQPQVDCSTPGRLMLATTGSTQQLTALAERWLGVAGVAAARLSI
jgi:glutamate racemase